jgi:hypothetical protein
MLDRPGWVARLTSRHQSDDEDDYVQREVLLRLKNRNRYISLIRDYDKLDTPKRVIFSEAAEG